MSKGILQNTRLFTGGCDLTSAANKIEWSSEVEDKDVTNFGSVDANGKVWKEILGGLASTKISASGQWEATDASKVDDALWSQLGGLAGWTVCPVTSGVGGTVGSLAYLTQALTGQYQLLGQVGEVAPWQAGVSGSWPMVRGTVLHPPGTARTATGTGTAVQQGAITSGKYGYAALHVLSVSGTSTPTLTVKVQSDDNSGFTSATDRITFTGATAISGQVGSVAGAVTDDWWRVSWTISGTNPSFLFLVSFGIA